MKLFLSIGLFFSLLVPMAVSAQTARLGIQQLPPTYVVAETAQELVARGCQVQTLTKETTSFLVQPEKPYPVVPSDIDTGQDDGEATVFFCSKTTIDSLTVKARVAGLIDRIASGVARGVTAALGAAGNIISKVLGTAMTFFLTTFANILTIILSLAAMGATYFLSYGTFLTNPIVQAGWPFVLGFANLGFVLALMFIALSTVLRLQSFQARRMLPRLLIAALLINFSLIIAVLMIDASRLVMSVTAQALTTDSRCSSGPIACLPASILRSSQLVQTVFAVHGDRFLMVSPAILGGDTRSTSVPFPGVIDTVQAMIVIALMALAFVVLALLLLVRWFALVILLVLSPLAYLFVALPGTEKWARMWWNNFIKYVLYGPAIVLILALFVKAQAPLYTALKNNFSDLNIGDAGITQIPAGDTVAGLFMTALTAGAIFAAAAAGQRLGVMGGNMATTRYKQGARLLGRTAYVGTGAQFAARRAGEFAGDVWRNRTQGIRADVARMSAARQQRLDLKAGADKRAIDEATREGQQQARDYRRRKLLKPWERVDQTAEERYASTGQAAQLGKAREWREGVVATQAKDGGPMSQAMQTAFTGQVQTMHPDQAFTVSALSNAGVVGSMSAEQLGLFAGAARDSQKDAAAQTLKSLPAGIAEDFDEDKIKAVLDSGDAKLIGGMISNAGIVKNMSSDNVSQALQHLADTKQNLDTNEPIYSNYLNQLGNTPSQRDIERVRDDYERDRRKYDKDMGTWKEQQIAFNTAIRQINSGGEKKA